MGGASREWPPRDGRPATPPPVHRAPASSRPHATLAHLCPAPTRLAGSPGPPDRAGIRCISSGAPKLTARNGHVCCRRSSSRLHSGGRCIIRRTVARSSGSTTGWIDGFPDALMPGPGVPLDGAVADRRLSWPQPSVCQRSLFDLRLLPPHRSAQDGHHIVHGGVDVRRLYREVHAGIQVVFD